MAAITFEAVFLPIIIVLGILAVKRSRAAQVRRIEEYRKSPDSHLLKLND